MPARRTTRIVCAAALAAAFAPSAFADAGPYLGVEGGVNFLDDEIVRQAGTKVGRMRYKDGYVGGLTFGAWTDQGFRPELELDYRRNNLARFRTEPLSESVTTHGYEDAYSAMGNLWYELNAPSGPLHFFHPYLGGGAGGARLAFHELNIDGVPYRHDFDTVFAWQAGGGFGINLSRDVLMTFDYRYLQTNIAEFHTSTTPGAPAFEQRYRANTALLGLQVRLGVAPPAPEIIVVKEPAPLPPPPPPPVEPDPCSFDADHDGVNDCEDRCPNTAAGFKVDASGCVIEQTVILHTVNFEFNSDRLTPPARQTLDEIAGTLLGQPSLYVEIGGHTDSIGSPEYNRRLSQRRADSVMSYLVSKGVGSATLTARGYGEDKPITSNATEDGRAENRRVEFVVLQKPTDLKVVPAGSTQESKDAAKTEPERIKREHGR